MRIVSLFLDLSIIAYSNLSLAEQPTVTRAAGIVSLSFGMNPYAALLLFGTGILGLVFARRKLNQGSALVTS
jgi:hypothetical protein